jgi:hypothetical protein
MKRIIFVVSRKHPDLVPRLEKESRGGSVEVVVDRRLRQRRRKADPHSFADRRHADRRTHSTDSELDLIGVAVVVVS